MMIFRRLGKKSESKRLKAHFHDDYDLFVTLWKKRFLRAFMGQETPDFQRHLINVMLDKYDEKVKEKYSVEVFEDFCLFLSEVNELKLFEEMKLLPYVEKTAEKVDEYAMEKGISFQEGIYKYLMEHIDV